MLLMLEQTWPCSLIENPKERPEEGARWSKPRFFGKPGVLGERAVPYVPPLRWSLGPAGSFWEQLSRRFVPGPCVPWLSATGGRVVLGVLSGAVSILHSAELPVLWAFASVVRVCSLAGLLPSTLSLWAGESSAGKLPQAPAGGGTVRPVVLARGRGGTASRLCRLENGDQKLPPLRKVVAVGSISPL